MFYYSGQFIQSRGFRLGPVKACPDSRSLTMLGYAMNDSMFTLTNDGKSDTLSSLTAMLPSERMGVDMDHSRTAWEELCTYIDSNRRST